AQRRCLLPRVQPAARQPPGGRGARTRARLVERGGRACPGGAGRPGAAARDGFSITFSRRERGRRGLRLAPRRRDGAPAPKAEPAAPTAVRTFFSSPLPST